MSTSTNQTTAGALERFRARIGQDNPPSDWLLITQERVNQFADVTLDHQFIHVDPERAKNTPFGGTIAHGFLTLSLCLMLPRYGEAGQRTAESEGTGPRPRMSVNYGLNKVRFPSPVPVGSRIRGSTRLLNAEEVAPGVIQNITQITIEVEGQSNPAAVVEMVGRHYY